MPQGGRKAGLLIEKPLVLDKAFLLSKPLLLDEPSVETLLQDAESASGKVTDGNVAKLD